MTYTKYQEIVKKVAPKKKTFRHLIFAFISGGLIGAFVELVYNFALNVLHFQSQEASFLSGASIVILAAILTMFSLYNNIAQHCGAGLFLPTTGFANSLTSAAMEGRSEGLVSGIGASIFSLAGSVIAYGVFISWYFATIYYLLNLWGINIWA